MICRCHWCQEERPHPESHTSWHRVSGRLVFAETPPGEDIVAMEACSTCGHARPTNPSRI